jgi:hypothetical protein
VTRSKTHSTQRARNGDADQPVGVALGERAVEVAFLQGGLPHLLDLRFQGPVVVRRCRKFATEVRVRQIATTPNVGETTKYAVRTGFDRPRSRRSSIETPLGVPGGCGRGR